MSKPLPVILYDSTFWKAAINFESFVKAKLVQENDLQLFDFADTPEQAWEELTARGLHIPKE